MVDVLVKVVSVELTILKPISIFEFLRYCWPSWISNVILATVGDSKLVIVFRCWCDRFG